MLCSVFAIFFNVQRNLGSFSIFITQIKTEIVLFSFSFWRRLHLSINHLSSDFLLFLFLFLFLFFLALLLFVSPESIIDKAIRAAYWNAVFVSFAVRKPNPSKINHIEIMGDHTFKLLSLYICFYLLDLPLHFQLFFFCCFFFPVCLSFGCILFRNFLFW